MNLSNVHLQIFNFFESEFGCKIRRDLTPDFLNRLFPTTAALTADLPTGALIGFGSNPNAEVAEAKAAIELIERLLFWTEAKRQPKGISSTNGMAVHMDLARAKDSALNELVERHVIIKAMLQRIPPFAFGSTRVQVNEGFRSDLHPEIFVWRGPFSRFVAIARYSVVDKNCYGFGAAESIDAAITKSATEASTRIGFAISGKSAPPSGDWSENFSVHFNARHEWTEEWLNSTFAGDIPKLDLHLDESSVQFSSIDLPLPLRGSLSAVRATCPLLQPLFSGQWDRTKINRAAVGQFEVFPPVVHLVG